MKAISRIAGVDYLIAKQMPEKNGSLAEIKETISLIWGCCKYIHG